MRNAAALLLGVATGQAVPLLILAPSFLWGDLNAVIDGGLAYFLIPALTLMLVPGWILGRLAADRAPDPKAAWRFAAGLFLGASITAGFILWRGTADLDAVGRIGATVFGGPILAGFWIWLGAVLGLSAGYQRKARDAPEAAA